MALRIEADGPWTTFGVLLATSSQTRGASGLDQMFSLPVCNRILDHDLHHLAAELSSSALALG